MDLILHVLVINWLSILNRIWFSHSLLNSVCFLEEATSLSQQKPFIMPLTSVWAMELILRQSETEYIDLRVRSWIGYQILGQVINRVHTTTQFWGYLPPPGWGGGLFRQCIRGDSDCYEPIQNYSRIREHAESFVVSQPSYYFVSPGNHWRDD